MGRDTRDPYREYRGDGYPGEPGGSRRDRTPRPGGGSYSGSGRSSGRMRQPYDEDGGDQNSSGRMPRGSTPPDRPERRYGSDPRSRRGDSPPPGYTDYDGSSTPPRDYTGHRAAGGNRGRRSMAELARDVSRTMSRQLSSVMSRVGRAVDGRRRDETGMQEPAPVRRPISAPGPLRYFSEEETLNLRAQAYRRSRIRLVARKWRLARVQRNPIVFLSVVMLIAVVVVLISAGGGAGGVYALSYYQEHQGEIQAVAGLRDQQNSTIYDRNGNKIYSARGNSNYQSYVPLSQISEKVQAATIDTEDHTFYSNDGVDFYGTLRAALADVEAGGSAAQGGSTITQQLVKNVVIDNSSQTITRKLNEAILAYGVTQQYTKGFILEMYLNTIPYGELNTGIEAAAENYFHLTPKSQGKNKPELEGNQQLDWAEAAILAGLPNAPSEYDPTQFSCSKAPCPMSQWNKPFQGPQEDCGLHIPTFGPTWFDPGGYGHEWLVFCRAELVLYNVYLYGVPGDAALDLTQNQFEASVREVANILVQENVYNFAESSSNSNNTASSFDLAPHFVEYVSNILATNFGITDLSSAGLSIYTTLDLNLQNEAQAVIQHYVNGTQTKGDPGVTQYPGQSPGTYCETWYPAPEAENCGPPLSAPDYDCSAVCGGNAHDGGLVAIDQRTGDILAMVGSVNYNEANPQVAGAFNVTTSNSRSMGSATKPLMYATAFQMGWTPGTMLQDTPVCFPNAIPNATSPVAPACNGWYVPQDYETNNFSGTFPLRYQFDGSLNIAATEGMEFVGATPGTSANFLAIAQRLGVSTLTADAMGPTTALGTQDISLLQLTGAYGTLANQGARAPSRAILSIAGPNGATLWSAPGVNGDVESIPPTEQAISPQAAYMVTSVLTDNVARSPFFKPHNPLVLDADDDGGKYTNLAIAAKTGTSSGTFGPLDIVTAGYTPYMTLGVWFGNTGGDDQADALNPNIIGVAGAGYVFHDVMLWAAEHYNWDPTAQFPVPPQMARGSLNCNTGLAPYAGSTAKDLDCAWNPDSKSYLPPGQYSNSTYNPYYDESGKHPSSWPDTDWYILGDQPYTS